MTKPVNMRLPADLLAAAELAAEDDGVTLAVFVTRAIEEKLLRSEFDRHARMVDAAAAAAPSRLLRRSRAIRDGLATWKAAQRFDGSP
ncbi:hypothetical protein [Nocardia suismassiliense]|uniref:hypothetical protein n=1 Tax=Nocardia suismassiliense TaxID=2077092 RepID=UPI00131F36BA|nr:hypothetical protein [Nocardia suismassiliense]